MLTLCFQNTAYVRVIYDYADGKHQAVSTVPYITLLHVNLERKQTEQ